MPTYEYECTKCAEVFELFQSMKDKPKRTIATNCKQCSNKAPVVRRIGGGAGIIFKGSGFYQTDYRSENYKKSAKAESGGGDSSPKKDGDAKKPAEAKTDAAAKKPEKPATKKDD